VQDAVRCCLDSCLACLDVLYLPRDAHPISSIAAAHNSWAQEAEPAPSRRDTWLRSAVPEVVVPSAAAAPPAAADGAPAGRGSTSSRVSTAQRGGSRGSTAASSKQRPLSGVTPPAGAGGLPRTKAQQASTFRSRRRCLPLLPHQLLTLAPRSAPAQPRRHHQLAAHSSRLLLQRSTAPLTRPARRQHQTATAAPARPQLATAPAPRPAAAARLARGGRCRRRS
jgi:hypothetical protein